MTTFPSAIRIYARYSCELQRVESCEDQIRKIRENLVRMGIDPDQAEIIQDQAESGTKEGRPGYQSIVRRIRDGEPLLLVVDDQSRLGRSDNVRALIQDLVFAGGRFISVADGIDTNRPGWEMLVGFKEIANSQHIRDLGAKVRRGQEGRILDDCGSAGDLCLGYKSEYVDPNWHKYNGRGPKPKKRVVIDEDAAGWVRKIFAWFLIGWSINKIARELTTQGAPKGPRSTKPGWHPQSVRGLLDNRKYIGKWPWGKTKTIRDSSGRKKQIDADPQDVVRVERPSLRIVDDDTWNRAQMKLKQLEAKYGKKDGQDKRGPKSHHSEDYPQSLLGGLLFCGKCDKRLHYQSNQTGVYYGCPRYTKGLCTQRTRVPASAAEDVLLDFLSDELSGQPGWVAEIMSAMREQLDHAKQQAPSEQAEAVKRRDKLNADIRALIELMKEAGVQSAHMVHEIKAMEQQLAECEVEIEQVQAREIGNFSMPEDSWVYDHLHDLRVILGGEVSEAAILLRKILGQVKAHEIMPPGKKRGYIQLRFQIDAWNVAACALPGRLIRHIHLDEDAAFTAEVRLDVGGPTRPDRLAPEIDRMRKEGKTWKEIAGCTGLSMGNASNILKRYRDAKAQDQGDIIDT